MFFILQNIASFLSWSKDSYLRLITNQDVVLYGVRDVVYSELEEGPLGNVGQADTCPGGTTVLRVWPLVHRHSLKR